MTIYAAGASVVRTIGWEEVETKDGRIIQEGAFALPIRQFPCPVIFGQAQVGQLHGAWRDGRNTRRICGHLWFEQRTTLPSTWAPSLDLDSMELVSMHPDDGTLPDGSWPMLIERCSIAAITIIPAAEWAWEADR